MNDFVTRRDLLKSGLAGSAGLLAAGIWPSRPVNAAAQDKLPVAAVVTIYTPGSHTDVIAGKILEGYQQDGGPGPNLKLVSMFTDQVPATDMSRAMAAKHGFQLASTINDALTLGTDKLQVAGVLSVGEHGNYPLTPDTKQQMYPRKRFFDEIVATFRRCGKSVPVFNDKHLSYKWSEARAMYDTSRELNFAFLAGSSVPLGWRLPVMELPIDCEIKEALTIGYSGLEIYGFHTLEAHQSMIERRRGGETGVSAVQVAMGPEILTTRGNGRWSNELFQAALKTLPGPPTDTGEWTKHPDAAVFLMEHRDGLRTAAVMANGLTDEFAFAVKLKGHSEPLATRIKLQPRAPHNHFAYLTQAIDHTIHTGRTAYPVERTLLTTGILDRVMQSVAQGGKRLETPELDVSYRAVHWPFANAPDSVMNLPND